MEFVSIGKILQIRPDTIQSIYKMYNLDKPGSLKEAIRILNEWIQKQPHFNKKDFEGLAHYLTDFQKGGGLAHRISLDIQRGNAASILGIISRWLADHYLEMAIILNKGSIERAKSQLDKMCTMRTLMPEFFRKYNCKTDFEQLYEVVHAVVLPKITDDHYRILVSKHFDVDWEPSQAIHYYRHVIIMTEYIKAHDYLDGSILIIDFSEANVMSFLKKTNPVLVRQAMILSIEGYGMRMKGIHIISESKFVDGLVTLLKQAVSAKIVSRIHVHKSVKALHEFIPKAILPVDYGGEERSLKTLQEEWLDVLSSEENLSYLEEMNKATTNESCRPKDQFFEQYSGMPGTFRFLSVD